MITDGQARRIAASWQTPRNSFGIFQHTGRVTEDLQGEVRIELMRSRVRDELLDRRSSLARAELLALEAYLRARGEGAYGGERAWSEQWDEEEVTIYDL